MITTHREGCYDPDWVAVAEDQPHQDEKGREVIGVHFVCPTPCDDECDETCHEVHLVRWKRGHDPSICISRSGHNLGPTRGARPMAMGGSSRTPHQDATSAMNRDAVWYLIVNAALLLGYAIGRAR